MYQGLMCYQACHNKISVRPSFLDRNQNFENAMRMQFQKEIENLGQVQTSYSAIFIIACKTFTSFSWLFHALFHGSVLDLIMPGIWPEISH